MCGRRSPQLCVLHVHIHHDRLRRSQIGPWLRDIGGTLPCIVPKPVRKSNGRQGWKPLKAALKESSHSRQRVLPQIACSRSRKRDGDRSSQGSRRITREWTSTPRNLQGVLVEIVRIRFGCSIGDTKHLHDVSAWSFSAILRR